MKKIFLICIALLSIFYGCDSFYTIKTSTETLLDASEMKTKINDILPIEELKLSVVQNRKSDSTTVSEVEISVYGIKNLPKTAAEKTAIAKKIAILTKELVMKNELAVHAKEIHYKVELLTSKLPSDGRFVASFSETDL